MAKHYELGKEGESLAAKFLEKNGYQILEKNWRFQKAEVDLIAQKMNTIVCVEVKTRTSNRIEDPQEAVRKKKIKLLVEAMNQYVITKDLDVEVRFDIIAITKTHENFDIQHLEDAFFHF